MSSIEYYNKRKKIKARRVYHLHKYKKSKGCEICGYNKHGAALEFDHIDANTKSHFCVGQGKGGSGMNGLTKRICIVGARKDSSEKNRKYIKELFEEIRKCRILCSNCHRIETYESGQPWKCVETFTNREVA